MREIPGDRMEQSRIRLERDIDNNIPPPPPMESDIKFDDDNDDVSSVDFARHNSHQHPSFHSFERPSHLDSDFYSRHGDDSIALDPDLGQTMSTAAHHASALTLSAGLRGRANYNQTSGRTSPGGGEYDPDRPLQAILDNRITDGISLFDATVRSKSKSVKSLRQDKTHSLPTFDPVIVDSTAELDRFLQTGHSNLAVPRSGLSYPYISRSHSQPNPGTSDASDSDASTPRLSQALGRHFSPKRPRSTPVPHPTNVSPPVRRSANPTSSHTAYTPKPNPVKPKPGPSNLNPVRSHPKRAAFVDVSQRAGDVEAQSRHNESNDNNATSRPPRRDIFPSVHRSVPGKRPPFADIVNKEPNVPTRNWHARVYLPDATGLTSAVQSPAKVGVEYVSADVAHPSLAIDLLPALDSLQTRLQTLERENGISRRRVRELELELEDCKAEVVVERTRVKEREREQNEEAIWERERERQRQVRGKMREEESRYREVLEEKKALEALVTTLRAHLARLTSELASQRALIAGLRTDAFAVRETHAEIDALRAEVERLAGEVERLKEIVEEGLRERRKAREGSSSPGAHEAKSTQEPDEPLTLDNLEPEDPGQEPEPAPEPEPISSRTERYIHAAELARVESEMHERRSERSLSSSRPSGGANNRDNDSGNGSSLRERDPVTIDQDQNPSHPIGQLRLGTDPTRSHLSPPDSCQRNATPLKHPAPCTPFPQIRGSRMERLFFSAPEHNARTCAVCHRRKRGDERRRVHQDEAEAFRKEEEAVKAYLRNVAQRGKSKEKRGEGQSEAGTEGDRLPPQTVLARVVRELEDDFSHYKAMYLELADQYGVMDAASNVAKRNVLADHLRDVIDTLEQKGDQIASLYELLNFRDKPLSHGAQNAKRAFR